MKITKEELKTINKYKKETHKNEGNITSNDNYVLENKTLKNLKEDLQKRVIDYFDKVVCTSNSIIPHITQSWINYTETNQFHHRHFHSNSYVSGVFYIDAKKEVEREKGKDKEDKPEPEQTKIAADPFGDKDSETGKDYVSKFTGEETEVDKVLNTVWGKDGFEGTDDEIEQAVQLLRDKGIDDDKIRDWLDMEWDASEEDLEYWMEGKQSTLPQLQKEFKQYDFLRHSNNWRK